MHLVKQNRGSPEAIHKPFSLWFLPPRQGDRARRGQPHDHPERGHRVRTHAAAARDGDGQHRRAHGLPEPDSGAHTAGVRKHFRQVESKRGSRRGRLLLLLLPLLLVFFNFPASFSLTELNSAVDQAVVSESFEADFDFFFFQTARKGVLHLTGVWEMNSESVKVVQISAAVAASQRARRRFGGVMTCRWILSIQVFFFSYTGSSVASS